MNQCKPGPALTVQCEEDGRKALKKVYGAKKEGSLTNSAQERQATFNKAMALGLGAEEGTRTSLAVTAYGQSMASAVYILSMTTLTPQWQS